MTEAQHPQRIGVLGGTFDPIHHGHLAAARSAERALRLHQLWFIPSARPPHRSDPPHASFPARLGMLQQAIGESPGWQTCDLESRRAGPSFTFDTLVALQDQGPDRKALSPSQIFFIIGADAFAEIESWHRYPDVLEQAHFVVITRPGYELETLRQRLPPLASRMVDVPQDADFDTPHIFLVSSLTPNVSSSDIRRRLQVGEPIEGLVPTAVAAYISQHHLYKRGSTPAASDGSVGKQLAWPSRRNQ